MSKYNELMSKVWTLFNVLRAKSERFEIVLFFLILRREGLLVNFEKEGSANIISDLKEQIKFNSNDPQLLGEIFNDFQFDLQHIGSFNVFQLVKAVNQIDRSFINLNFESIFEEVLKQIVQIRGIAATGIDLPSEITELVSQLINIPDNATVYNPFAGICYFGVNLSSATKYIAQEYNQQTLIIGRLRLYAHGKNTKIFQQNALENWNPYNEKFDYVISSPPFGGKINVQSGKFGPIRRFDSFFIEKGIEVLKENGKLISIVTNSFLFDSFTSKLREDIIKNNQLEMVISLPKGLLFHTTLPLNILIVNKNKLKNTEVVFVDGSNFVSLISRREKVLKVNELYNTIRSKSDTNNVIVVSNEEIVNNDFSFAPLRYFPIQIEQDSYEQTVKLGELLTSVGKSNDITIIPEKYIRIKDLKADSNDYLLDIKSIEEIEDGINLKTNKNIAESCLLVSTRFNKLKPTYFEYQNTPITISSGILAFRVDTSKIDINYLIYELSSTFVSQQIEKFSTGSTIPNISLKNLTEIQIRIPNYHGQLKYAESLREQISKVRGIIEANIRSKEESLSVEKIKLGFDNDAIQHNAFLRHTLSAPASNLLGAFSKLKTIIENHLLPNNPQFYSLKISELHEHTFGKYLEIIERDIQNINLALKQQLTPETNIESKVLEPIEIVEFVQNYISDYNVKKDLNFKFQLEFDEMWDQENPTNNPKYINANKDLLNDLLNNIVQNAIDHAFTIEGQNRIDLFFIDQRDDGLVSLLISNTGKHLPDDFSFENFVLKGFKYGSSKGNGFGGWLINEIAKKLNAKFEITDENKYDGLIWTELSATFEFAFPTINVEENENI